MKINELAKFLRAYQVVRQTVEENFQNGKKVIDLTYNQNTTVYQQKIDDLRKAADAKIEEAKEGCIARVNMAFNEANAAVNDYMITPLNEQQTHVLSVLSGLKDSVISEAEADVYAAVLKTNYNAMRSGYPLLSKASGKAYSFMTYDEAKEYMNRIEKKTRNWVTNYNPDSYEYFDFLTTYEDDLISCESQLEAFLSGKADPMFDFPAHDEG